MKWNLQDRLINWLNNYWIDMCRSWQGTTESSSSSSSTFSFVAFYHWIWSLPAVPWQFLKTDCKWADGINQTNKQTNNQNFLSFANYLVYGKARGLGLELYRNKGPCEADSGRVGLPSVTTCSQKKKQFLVIPSKYPPGISKKPPPQREVQVLSPFLKGPPKQRRKNKSVE